MKIHDKLKIIKNKTFNYLTPYEIDHDKTKQLRNHYFKCKCKCGNDTSVNYNNLIRGAVKSCGCMKNELCHKLHWKGCGDLSGMYWANLKSNAKKRNIKVTLTIKEAWELFESQDKKCAISGVPIHFNTEHWKKRFQGTASLDRIDPTKDYSLDNVQWVHKQVNYMKQSLQSREFLDWCNLIVNFNKPKDLASTV